MIAPGPRSLRRWVSRFRAGRLSRQRDVVAVEEPLEIRVEWYPDGGRVLRSVAVTMRTPGDDFELAAGFLSSEGLLGSPADVREIAYCGDDGPTEFNRVTIRLRRGVVFDTALIERNFYTTSSCGVCGKGSLEALEIRGEVPFSDRPHASCPERTTDTGTDRGPWPLLSPDILTSLPAKLRDSQAVFDRTGGIHAAGLFEPDGVLRLLREDVGRHNAVDKVIGRAFLDRDLPLHGSVLVVSGRTSFEIMQKALAAGIPIVAAVGAPSTLAVEIAREYRMTLAGFVRDGGFNLYSMPERVGVPGSISSPRG